MDGKVLKTLPIDNIEVALFNPIDNTNIVCLGYQKIIFCDLSSNSILQINDNSQEIVFDFNGKYVATLNNYLINMYDPKTGVLMWQIINDYYSPLEDIALSPLNNIIAACSFYDGIKIWTRAGFWKTNFYD
jgi:hypothetical protein